MTRRTGVLLVCLFVLLGLLAALGGAGAGNAGPRIIDEFTMTATPTPAMLGKRVTVTVSFHNASGQPLTQANGLAIASNGATLSEFSASQGTCSADPADSSRVNCAFGKLQRDAVVAATLVYFTPATASLAESMQVDFTLFTNENCGGKCDPGSVAQHHPTPNPITIPLDPPDANKVIDVVGRQGGTFGTDAVTETNDTNFAVTVPGKGVFLPIVLFESGVDAAVCGTEAESVRANGDLTVPGVFAPEPLTIVMEMLGSGIPFNRLVACHNGVVLDDCVEDEPIPSEGCLDLKERFRVDGVLFYRLTSLGGVNGKWGGGLG